MSRTVVSIEGFRELDAALAELPKAIAKNATKRALAKAAEPIAEEARRLVPVNTGTLKESISVSTKLKNKVGEAEFSAVMRAGGSKSEAVSAMRDARRAAGAPSFAEVFIGPSVPSGFYGHLVEFGTSHSVAQPFLRPAWDAQKMAALGLIKGVMAEEIIAAAKRVAKSKRYGADIKYRASIGAMIAAGG